MQARLFWLAVVGSVLTGCVQVPVEHREPYKTVTVDMPSKAAYKNLTAYPYCGFAWNVKGDFDSYDRTFQIRFTFNGLFGAESLADVIDGESVGEKTVLTLRTMDRWQEPISQKFLTRLQTGKCE